MIMELDLAVLQVLATHPEFRGLAKPQIETRVGLEGHDVAGGSQLKNLKGRELVHVDGRTWPI